MVPDPARRSRKSGGASGFGFWQRRLETALWSHLPRLAEIEESPSGPAAPTSSHRLCPLIPPRQPAEEHAADLDLLVIGGSCGVACARRAASHWARVGLADTGPVKSREH